MGLFSFKNTPRPRRFNHVPIYWDPEKEKREEREASIEKDLRGNKEREYTPKLARGSFRKYSERSGLEKNTKENKKLVFKLALILSFLIILGYYLFMNSDAIISLYLDNTI